MRGHDFANAGRTDEQQQQKKQHIYSETLLPMFM